jgi:hypothetical protein
MLSAQSNMVTGCKLTVKEWCSPTNTLPCQLFLLARPKVIETSMLHWCWSEMVIHPWSLALTRKSVISCFNLASKQPGSFGQTHSSVSVQPACWSECCQGLVSGWGRWLMGVVYAADRASVLKVDRNSFYCLQSEHTPDNSMSLFLCKASR